MHRWDAQDAVGEASPIAAWLARDGIEEYLDVMLPRMLERGVAQLPSAPGVVLIEADAGTAAPALRRTVSVHDDALVSPVGTTGEPDAVVRGGAEDLLLVLWGRRDADRLEVEGDAALAAAWLSLGGN